MPTTSIFKVLLDLFSESIHKLNRTNKYRLLQKKGLRIGKNVSIQKDVILDPSHCFLIEIGDNVSIAPRVIILAHDASMNIFTGYTIIAKVKIGNSVFIGANSIILPGVTIGDNSIIGAGSVVTANIPHGSIVAGNPAKVIGNIEEFKKKHMKMLSEKPIFPTDMYDIDVITPSLKKEMILKLKNDNGYLK